MVMTDKQLLQLTKTELLEEYRKLEQEKKQSITIEEAIQLLQESNYIVRKIINYEF